MSDTTRSVVKFNSREQILSNDLNLLQKLSSREAQNLRQYEAQRDTFTDPTGSPTGPGYTGTPGDNGIPITRSISIGNIAPTVSTFNFTVGAGSVEAYESSADPDTSNYQILRWSATPFTSAPDGSQSRIDVVYATPTMVDSDLESRNVLLDPVARTMAPQNVFKRSDPTAILTLLSGTPGSNVAPAVPSGSVVIWEIVTKASNTDATQYSYIRRVWRRVESFGTCHGVLENCVPWWNPGDDGGASGTGAPLPRLRPGVVHRAVIDGEIICWPQTGDDLRAVMDSGGDPTGLGAATHDQPFYLYLCGGRFAPQQGLPFYPPFTTISPLRLVASTQAPNLGGRASGDLTFGGVTIPRYGTLYVGIGFISTTGNGIKPCVIDGDWIYPQTSAFVDSAPTLICPQVPQFTEAPIFGIATSGAAGIHPPALSTMCDLAGRVIDPTPSATTVKIYPGSSVGTGNQVLLRCSCDSGGNAVVQQVRCAVPASGVLNWEGSLAALTARLDTMATGYNMNVKRFT